jgi:hypothetical protein
LRSGGGGLRRPYSADIAGAVLARDTPIGATAYLSLRQTPYHISTTSGAFALFLPPRSSLYDGAVVTIFDVGNYIETNNCTINGNGVNIKFQNETAASTLTWVGPNSGFLTFVYDASQNLWLCTGV